MQQPVSNYPLGKDKDIPEEEWHLGEETEQPQCGPENSNSDGAPWKHPDPVPLSCMREPESSSPEVEPQSLGASPRCPPRSLSKQYCENQGNLLHFDRQAPGRISTSPTLRRLRGRGFGTSHSLPQQETLEGPTWGSWKEPAGFPCYLSKSLPGSPKDSSHSLPPWELHSRLPPDPKRTLKTADSLEPQTGPTDEDTLPVLQPLDEGSLPQACLPERGGHSLPSPTARPPRSQVLRAQTEFCGAQLAWTRGIPGGPSGVSWSCRLPVPPTSAAEFRIQKVKMAFLQERSAGQR